MDTPERGMFAFKTGEQVLRDIKKCNSTDGMFPVWLNTDRLLLTKSSKRSQQEFGAFRKHGLA